MTMPAFHSAFPPALRPVALLAAFAFAVAAPAARAQQTQPMTPLQPAGQQPSGEKPAAKDTAPAKKLYDETADARQQIATALTTAKKNNQRVLIQWGGNWCTWCIVLHKKMTADATIAKVLRDEYVVVHIDAGVPDGKNLDLAASYGADLKANGFPFLTVLDADGKAVVNQETAALEVKDASGESVGTGAGHDMAKVLAFLKAHTAPAADAQAVLDRGLAEAKSSGKLVFLHFGAPWCGWCHRLEAWMGTPEAAPLLERAFVDVKIDVDRFTGGKEILAKYNPKEGGIPWFAFLDADGKVIADSNAQGATGPQNVGFPAAPEEIAHFEAMLTKVTALSDAERATLVESLKKGTKAAGR